MARGLFRSERERYGMNNDKMLKASYAKFDSKKTFYLYDSNITYITFEIITYRANQSDGH